MGPKGEPKTRIVCETPVAGRGRCAVVVWLPARPLVWKHTSKQQGDTTRRRRRLRGSKIP